MLLRFCPNSITIMHHSKTMLTQRTTMREIEPSQNSFFFLVTPPSFSSLFLSSLALLPCWFCFRLHLNASIPLFILAQTPILLSRHSRQLFLYVLPGSNSLHSHRKASLVGVFGSCSPTPTRPHHFCGLDCVGEYDPKTPTSDAIGPWKNRKPQIPSLLPSLHSLSLQMPFEHCRLCKVHCPSGMQSDTSDMGMAQRHQPQRHQLDFRTMAQMQEEVQNAMLPSQLA